MYDELTEIACELEDIAANMDQLLSDAKILVSRARKVVGAGGSTFEDRFNAYTYPHLKMAIVREHDFLGSSVSLEHIAGEIRQHAEDDEEIAREERGGHDE